MHPCKNTYDVPKDTTAATRYDVGGIVRITEGMFPKQSFVLSCRDRAWLSHIRDRQASVQHVSEVPWPRLDIAYCSVDVYIR